MKYEAKTYKKSGAMAGSIVGVLLMIVAVCLHKTVLGAILLIVCACIGVIIGHIIESKKSEKKPKYVKIITILMLQMILLSGCVQGTSDEAQWGSFTSENTYSYDKKYVAEQTIATEESTQTPYIRVSIKDTEDKKEVFHFTPARASDFWGVCWESNSYNIWIQSGDIGVICYKYEDETWTPDETAIRPDDIVSKYDSY